MVAPPWFMAEKHEKNTQPYKFAKNLPIMGTSYNISISNYYNQTWKFGDKISLNEGLEA